MEPINELAARWAVRVDSGSLGPDEQRELDAWLNADPRHRGAYVRVRAHWVDLDRLATLRGPASPVATTVKAHRGISRRELLAASVAASTILGGGLSWLLFRRGLERYTSGIGEVRRIALEDGSTLLLNTDTEVTTEFSRQQRNLRLIRGEALFEVAHDPLRPFVVVAKDTAVRAVGTAFAVRLESIRPQVDVTVTEGVVEIASSVGASGVASAGSRAAEPDAKRVSANERVVIASARAPEISAIAPAEAERQLAWREGQVSFDGESLQTAVAEINRHNRRQIVVDDPALAAKPIIGVFRATDLAGFSAAAAAALKAKAVPDGDVIRLQPVAAQTPN